MKRQHYKGLLAAASLTLCAGISSEVLAANWLMLQGTQPPSAGPRAKIWGFIQPEYQQTDGTDIGGGPWKDQDAIFNQIRPDLDTDAGFNLIRARLGVRGTAMPIDPNVDYFLLAEFGNNGITRPGGGTGSVKLTDASITLNHFKDAARVRIGQFKYPGSEEGLKAIHVFDYINFTNVTNQMMLERFFDYDGSGTQPPFENSGRVNAPNGPVNAFRDIGVQVFNTFKQQDWEHSYAVMVGNGNGITRGDNNSDKDWYAYWSSEKVFGGRGPRREGWKFYAWWQDGTRTLIDENGTGDHADDFEADYDRTRYGIGSTYRQGNWRAEFEWIKADGMIFGGTDGGALPGATAQIPPGPVLASFNVLPEEEADGWYVDVGYKPHPKWEIDARYDVLNRATETDALERKFETLTLGAQYFFNKKTRLIANYEIRDAEAPNLPGSAPPNQVLDSMDDRISLQFLLIY